MSKRQNINSRSSPEAELIGSDEILPAFLWFIYFIDAKGLDVEKAVMYQDNLIDVLLDNNGRLSSFNWNIYIHVIYFPIKDIIAIGYLKVKYFPMG